MKTKGRGKIFIIAGLLLIAAALCLTVYNIAEQEKAAASVSGTLQKLESVTGVSKFEAEQDVADYTSETDIPDYVRNPNVPMPEAEIDGESYIGIVSIPSLELSLPVISRWSFPRLQIAPCRYLGSVYLDDMIIMAHNYSSHFGTLGDIHIDDAVYFEDIDGNTFAYRVVELEHLEGTSVDEMSAGDWDLTLFTCTVGGQSRITVRCVRAEME